MIQGESGSITKYASILFRRWLIENNLTNYVFITNLVHDEINVECKIEYIELVKTNLELAMKTSADMWCKIIPLQATAVESDYWGH